MLRLSPSLLAVALCACTSTLSNDVFVEDGRFAAALPSEASAGAPTAFDALTGDAELVAYAAAGSAEVDGLTLAPRAIGEVLRDAVPDERSAVHRAWDAVAVVLEGPDGAVQGWVRAEILLTEGDELAWTAWLAPEEEGPWSPVGSGQHHDGEDLPAEGGFTWQRGVVSAITGDTAGGSLEVAYALDDPRHIELLVRPDALSPPEREYRVQGDNGLVFPALFDLGATPTAGVAVAFHTPEGGRADGFLAPDATPFSACWDASGNGTFLGPSEAVEGYGTEADCALDTLTEP
ncbi:MAG: hypothetical protein EP330_29915 [Deltaproteobacteria bacterium]|nr:MAG: hypothetical protein EP330_29915 [Deltaproteobacteria bacterium]